MDDQKYNASTRQRIADIGLGFRVDRTVSTHINATTPYFTISGGPILLTGLVGRVVVASGANACSWAATPTAGAATSLSANLDINPAVTGDLITITGVGSDAMTYNASVTGLAMMTTNVIVPIGTLDFIAAAADGSTVWSMFYYPLAVGANVVVA